MFWRSVCTPVVAAIVPCLVLAGLSGLAQAGPVRLQIGLPLVSPASTQAGNPAQSGALLDYLAILAQQDPNFVETAVEAVLDTSSFMDGVTNPADVSTPQDVQKLVDDYNNKVIKDVEAAIKKLLEEFAKDISQLPPQAPVNVDVEVEITDLKLELLVNPYDIIKPVQAGTLPIAKKLRKAKPVKIKAARPPPPPPPPPVPHINFSLLDTVALLDDNDVATFSLTRASLRLFQVPTPSSLALVWLALLGCAAVSRSLGARRSV